MKSRTKALYLTYDGLTDPLGQSQILPYLIGLEQKGWDFSIISFEKSSTFERLKAEVKASIAGKNIEWIPLQYTKQPPVLSTIFDLLRMKYVAQKLDLDRYELIHCRSYLTMLVGMRLKRSHRLIFDMRGLWADERVEGKLWPQNALLYRGIYRYFRKKEAMFFQSADAVISLTQEGLLALKERYGDAFNENKVSVIPCCVDTAVFETGVTAFRKQEMGFSEDARILMHVGSVGTWYRFDQELVFFKALKAIDSRWCFAILTGDMPTARALVKQAKCPEDAIFIKNVNHREVPQYLKTAELSVQFIEPSFSKRASFPVRLVEALAMGVPVVTNAGIGDVAQILQEGKAGVVLSSWNELSEAALNWSSEHYNRISIRAYAVKKFGLDVGVKQYANVYHSSGSYD